MGLSTSKIRRIIECYPLPDKRLNDILQQWMIELAEELADNLLENVETSEKLASKEDIKQLIELSNTRFEALQKEQMVLRQEMNARFEAMEKANAARFEALQKEQMALRQEMNARFEAMEKSNATRFEALQNQIKFLMWYLGAGGVLVILKLFFQHIFPH
jgi:phage host-nuclease inhibitor protein Gam